MSKRHTQSDALPVRRGRYQIATPSGPKTMDGWICGCIGWIALGSGLYGLSHLPTGMRIAAIQGRTAAWQAAHDLNGLFTEPGTFGQPPPEETYADAKAYMLALRERGIA